MPVIKVIEVMATSNTGWEDAAKNAVKHAAKSVKNIKSVYIKDQSARVQGENLSEYRVNVKISFEVE